MKRYLETWKGSIPLSQAKLIEMELRERQKRGELLSPLEFTTELKRLTEVAKRNLYAPKFKTLYSQIDEIIDVETHNYYLDNIFNDLQILFEEANTLDTVNSTHSNRIEKESLPKLELIAKQLETQIDTYELLDGLQGSFNYMQFNDFKNTLDRTSREEATSLFLDPVSQQALSNDFDCVINNNSGQLHLPLDINRSSTHQISTVRIYDDLTTTGDFYLEPLGGVSNLENGIIGWVREIYYFIPQSVVPSVGIEVRFNGLQEINYIKLSPLGDIPFILENIEYTDLTGNRANLLISDSSLLGTEIAEPITIPCVPTSVASLIFHFAQQNYTSIQTQQGTLRLRYRGHSSIPTNITAPTMTGNAALIVLDEEVQTSQAVNQSSIPLQTGPTVAINPYIGGAIEYNPVLPSSPVLPGAPGTQFDMVKYSIGIAKVEVGLNQYQDIGIFVSIPTEVPRLKFISFSVEELLPDKLPAVLGKEAYIEYYLYKEDYANNTIISSQVFPILPSDATKVTIEKLHLNTSNISYLRFPCQYDDGGAGLHDLKIYRNNLLLTEGTDWSFITDSTSSLTGISFSDPSTQTEDLTDSIIAVYTPRHLFAKYGTGGTGQFIYNLDSGDMEKYYITSDRTLAYLQNGLIEHDPNRIGTELQYSRIRLIVIMKSSNLEPKKTSFLNQYKLYLKGEDLALNNS